MKFEEIPEDEMSAHPVFSPIKEQLQIVQRKLTKRPAIELRIRDFHHKILNAAKAIQTIDTHMADFHEQRQKAVKDHAKFSKLLHKAELSQVARVPSSNTLHQLELIM